MRDLRYFAEIVLASITLLGFGLVVVVLIAAGRSGDLMPDSVWFVLLLAVLFLAAGRRR